MTESTHLHASCVSIDGKGVLLMGDSGSGKSDLALRLIDAGAQLVADDQVFIEKTESQLLASPPERLHGLIEARGIGILHLPYASNVPVALAVKLVPREAMDRLPPPQFFHCLSLEVPLHSLYAFDSSTAAKIRLCLKAALH